MYKKLKANVIAENTLKKYPPSIIPRTYMQMIPIRFKAKETTRQAISGAKKKCRGGKEQADNGLYLFFMHIPILYEGKDDYNLF